MKITMGQLELKLKELLAEVKPGDGESFGARVFEFYQYALENYEELDADAKARVDKASDALREQLKQAIEAMPEGPDRRRLVRQFAIAEGKHFRADGLIAILESAPQDNVAVLPASRETTLRLIQHILDVLFDVTRHSHKGSASFAKIGLCYWSVDELLVSLHLAQRAFTNQAYAHIRTVFEILDLIELFDTQPQWTELWVSEDHKRVWNELKPSEVRKKLGGAGFDPIYSFFSELGSHGTFKGLQARGGKRSGAGETGRPRFTLWVGGCPMEHHVVWTNTYCVYAALRTLLTSIRAFHGYLNVAEMSKLAEDDMEQTITFFRQHYVEWATRQGLDATSLISFLEKKPWRAEAESKQRPTV